MKKRAERFGANVASSLTTAEDNDKKLKRKERFGLTAADLSVDVSILCGCIVNCYIDAVIGEEKSKIGEIWRQNLTQFLIFTFA